MRFLWAHIYPWPVWVSQPFPGVRWSDGPTVLCQFPFAILAMAFFNSDEGCFFFQKFVMHLSPSEREGYMKGHWNQQQIPESFYPSRSFMLIHRVGVRMGII